MSFLFSTFASNNKKGNLRIMEKKPLTLNQVTDIVLEAYDNINAVDGIRFMCIDNDGRRSYERLFVSSGGYLKRVLPFGGKRRYEAVLRPSWYVVRPCMTSRSQMKERAHNRLVKALGYLSKSGLWRGLRGVIGELLEDRMLFDEFFNGVYDQGFNFVNYVQYNVNLYPRCARNDGIVRYASMLSSFAATEFWKSVRYPGGTHGDPCKNAHDKVRTNGEYNYKWLREGINCIVSVDVEKSTSKRIGDRTGYYNEVFPSGDNGIVYLMLDETHAMYFYDF